MAVLRLVARTDRPACQCLACLALDAWLAWVNLAASVQSIALRRASAAWHRGLGR